ncbi:MAG: branched-chain amino acid transport system II carrier protein, partial [Atribacterota bacterium]
SIVVLILSALYYNFAKIKNSVTVGVIIALIFGLGDMLSFYGLTSNIITKIASQLPLGGQGLGWLLPTIIIMAIAQLFLKPKNEEEKSV